jgi:hypothetical protein
MNILNVVKEWVNYKLFQWVVEIHHAYYIINYPYGMRWYKLLVPRKRGPVLIDTISNENGVDIKDIVLQYAGPGYNFHGQHITPKHLGYNKVIVKFIDDNESSFDSNEPIHF